MTGIRSGRGRLADYFFGTERLGWTGLQLVRFHGVEELSRPFHYDVVLRRDAAAGPIDLDALLDVPASLCVASDRGWLPIHGLVTEAEELDWTRELILYRVALAPRLCAARQRRRCRNFVDKTLEEIVTTVLENRSPEHPGGYGGLFFADAAPAPMSDPDFAGYDTPMATYRFSVGDRSRLQDRALHPYVAQYNESDFDFLSRLLERAGLTYWFEHGRDETCLALSDRPGEVRHEAAIDLRSGSEGRQAHDDEVVRAFRRVRRARPRAVTTRGVGWERPREPYEAQIVIGGDPEVAGHFEFPVHDPAEQAPAYAEAERRFRRYRVEAALCEGSGTVRSLAPGLRFHLRDAEGLREDAEHVVVRVESWAVQHEPEGTVLDREPFGPDRDGGRQAPPEGRARRGVGFDNRFATLPAGVPFVPDTATPKPRIAGVETAVVTAEDAGNAPEIHCDAYGRVRVRFHWDGRPDDGTPTSDWIRVSQHWAGPGFGAMYVPRVGHEVLVAYLQGDPDHPVIVGRVYSHQAPPPTHPVDEHATQSTLRSQSSPDADGHNELRFEDLAGREQIHLHAQRDLEEIVRVDHSTAVGGDQSNTVGGDRTERIHGVEQVRVDGDHTTVYHANESRTVAKDRTTSVVGNDARVVGVDASSTTAGNETRSVGGDDAVAVSGERRVRVDKDHSVSTPAAYRSSANDHEFASDDAFTAHARLAALAAREQFIATAAGTALDMKSGVVELTNGAGAAIRLIGGVAIIQADIVVVRASGGIVVDGAMTSVGARSGNLLLASNANVTIKAGANVDASGTLVNLNSGG